ncbi:TonB-dependent receptor [Geofilum sp. OHC36d9]|uniref:TonB-dependent receptor n=1 Tax=Geofilum sp. OHC36d9 TaxID=3458413 RepID=UPI004034E4D7
MKFRILLFLTLALVYIKTYAGTEKPPVNIIKGKVTTNGSPLPYATIQIKSTTIGTSSDVNGTFSLEVPDGDHKLRVQAMGYKPIEISLNTENQNQKTLNIPMEEDALLLEQVVVTADRNARKRTESSVVVNTLDADLLAQLQSTSLSEGLSFCPGLRVENTCGNCGSNQLRMNGLDGPYSQILINGRPIFSGLASVYGLELMPANMIERIEVVRGGGSALYGSNAIAGTVNVIMREPLINQYEVQLQSSLIGIGGQPEPDNTIRFNTTITSDDRKQGLALYGFYRNRSPYDDNNDGFSELAKIRNTTMGLHYSLKTGYKSKITADYFHINEMRRGGNAFDKPLHETLIAEATDHQINSGNLTYHLFTKPDHELTLFMAAQSVDRDSYYGASRALDAYGTTNDLSISAGSQYKMTTGSNTLIFGAELNGSQLEDEKLGYRTNEYDAVQDKITEIYHDNRQVADQKNTVGGVFSQWERRMGTFSLSAGLRLDYYDIKDQLSAAPDISNTVLSPRLNLLYGLNKPIQARISYSKGYRAPQIFDEDLHIETSEARQIVHVNDPTLKQETSNSYMASLNYQLQGASNNIELLAEFFYTDLQNPFYNDIGLPNENGVVTYTRVNEKDGAIVKGINMEATWLPSSEWRLNGSYTIQSSEYGAPQDFNETRFLRTPNQYGYFMIEWNPLSTFSLSSNGTYTGEMLIPYFGPTIANPEIGELRTSDTFFDWSVTTDYTLETKAGHFQFIIGMKNILNSYQDDIDIGSKRDPGYIYGPMTPRTLFFGIKISNI